MARMHRALFASGLVCLAIFSGVAVLAYPHATSDCSTDVFTGNATNPAGCNEFEDTLGVSILAIGISAAIIVAAIFLGRKSKVPTGPRVPAKDAPPRDAIREDETDAGDAGLGRKST